MVEWKKLGDICEIIRGNGVQKTDFVESGVGCIHYGQIYTHYGSFTYTTNKYVSKEVFDKARKASKGDIIMTDTSENVEDICKSVAYLGEEDIAVSNHALILKHKQNPKFLTYSTLTNSFSNQKRKFVFGAKVSGIKPENLAQIKIYLPSLSEQNRIVGILDTFTASIDNLKEQIAQRRKQYEYYRDQLLDLEGKEGVEMKYLLDVLAQPVTDGPHETPSFYEDGIPFISADAIVDNKINFSRKRGYISEEYDLLCQKKYKPQLNDIYLVKSGSTTGKVAIVRTDERFNIWSPLAAIRVNQRNHPYFVYYMLQTKKVQDQVKLKSSQGSQPNLSMRVLEKFIIPVPPLSEQQRVVSILDTFEASILNLEAQLSQREKQYEYYRNKLLTFE